MDGRPGEGGGDGHSRPRRGETSEPLDNDDDRDDPADIGAIAGLILAI
jgi:hypothetical protein